MIFYNQNTLSSQIDCFWWMTTSLCWLKIFFPSGQDIMVTVIKVEKKLKFSESKKTTCVRMFWKLLDQGDAGNNIAWHQASRCQVSSHTPSLESKFMCCAMMKVNVRPFFNGYHPDRLNRRRSTFCKAYTWLGDSDFLSFCTHKIESQRSGCSVVGKEWKSSHRKRIVILVSVSVWIGWLIS